MSHHTCVRQLEFFYFELLAAVFAFITACILIYVFRLVYNLTKTKSGKFKDVKTSDKKILFVIFVLIISMCFKICEKSIKAYA